MDSFFAAMNARDFVLIGLVLVVVMYELFRFGKWLYKVDEKIEDRRRQAIVAAGEIKSLLGWDELAAIFISYGVGDYDDLGKRIVALLEMLQSEKTRSELYDQALQKFLTKISESPERLAKLQADLKRLATASKAAAS